MSKSSIKFNVITYIQIRKYKQLPSKQTNIEQSNIRHVKSNFWSKLLLQKSLQVARQVTFLWSQVKSLDFDLVDLSRFWVGLASSDSVILQF